MAVASLEDAFRSPGPFRLVAQLSDPHIVEAGALCMDRIDTAGFLRRALDTLSQLRPAPELLLCSGDLVNDGRPEQYAHLRELLSGLAFPVHLMCGNHDDRVALRAAFPDHDYLGVYGPCDYVVDALEPLRLIALDTMVANTASGQLSADQLHWLDRQLAAGPEQPTLVAMHHPPFATGIAHMDAMGLEPRAALDLAYGQKLVASGPLISKAVSKGNTVRCEFTEVGAGLMVGKREVPPTKPGVPTSEVVRGSLTGFEIAGADGKFHPAKAVISGRTTVDVVCPEVATPVAVRYAWAGAPLCNLYNRIVDARGNSADGLPASPFSISTSSNP